MISVSEMYDLLVENCQKDGIEIASVYLMPYDPFVYKIKIYLHNFTTDYSVVRTYLNELLKGTDYSYSISEYIKLGLRKC